MSENPSPGGREAAAAAEEDGSTSFDALPVARPRRPMLWLLLVPAVLYCAAPLVANSIEPRIAGVPFLLAWVIAASVVSPLVLWLVARLDPAYRDGALEPIPADEADGGEGPGAGSGTAREEGGR